MNQLAYSPITKLVDGYVKTGQKDKARELLLKQLSAASFDQYDQEYASYQRIENANWAADKLLKMELPIDAVKIYRDLLDQPEKLAVATRYNGNRTYENGIRNGLSKALASVTSKNVGEVMGQLMAVPETLTPGTPAVDLMISVPDAQVLTKELMKSSYLEVLTNLSKEASVASNIGSRLSEMEKQHAGDLSIGIVVAAWKLSMKHEDAAAAVKRLVVLVHGHPLEEIPVGRRPNSRQRRAAAQLLPVWLVARECIGTANLHDEGTALAEMCRAAAERQLGIKERSAILFDWGNLLLKAGRKEEAEARWSEMLDLAVERTSGKKPDRPPNKTSYLLPSSRRAATTDELSATSMVGLLAIPLRANFIPTMLTMQVAPRAKDVAKSEENAAPGEQKIAPLTLSQFRTAIVIARAAAQNGMSELSCKAVRESLKGGFPVPDPTAQPNTTDPFASQAALVFSRSSAGPPSASDAIEKEVVTSLKEIVSLWKGEDYPSQDRYTLLKALVLPENRPQEIRMYVTSSDMLAAKVDSLAETVVTVAAEAGQLEDLRAAIAKRRTDLTKTAASVLEILIELKQGNVEQVLKSLSDVSQHFQKGMPTGDQPIAFLAALRAFEKPDFKNAAFPILRQTLQQSLQNLTSQNRSPFEAGGPENNSRLATMVNQHLAATGDRKLVQEYFEGLLLGRQAIYARNSGDYALYQQWSDLVSFAKQAAELNMASLAMEYLGRASDFELPRNQPRSLGPTLAAVVRYTRSMPPDERYAAWCNWTLPTEQRQSLRVLHEAHLPTFVPRTFTNTDHPYETQVRDRLLSNFTELVDAARHVEKLEELKAKVQSLVESKMPSADLLLALVLIAQEDDSSGVPLVQSLRKSFPERMKPPAADNPGQRRPSANGDYLLFHACLNSRKFAGQAEDQMATFRRQLSSNNQNHLLLRMNLDFANRATSNTRPDWTSRGGPLLHWHSVGGVQGMEELRPWWTTFENQLVQLGGSNGSLYFNYPITGNFTISMDCFENAGIAGSVGFGGVHVRAASMDSGINISSVAGHETFNRKAPLKRSPPTFHQLAIEVRDDVVRHWLDNQLLYQENATITSPWLLLGAYGFQLSGFRNLEMRGDAVIPNSVRLIDGEIMDGWNCGTFSETQPRTRLMKERPADENDNTVYLPNIEPSVFSWSTKEGILKGTPVQDAAPDQPSWIYYHRPLVDGESIDYDFYYTPETSVAHPTIGRVALMIEPDGVRSHWIAIPSVEGSNGIESDNVVVEEGIRRGPARLPLKEKDWNNVRIELRDNKSWVTLNGTLICERPIEPELTTHIGFFRYRNQSTQVRNVVLKGNWPTSLPKKDELLSLKQAETPESVLSMATILDDELIAPQAAEVVTNARSMTASEAFDYLSNWVLPSKTHSHFRFFYSKVPAESNGDTVRHEFGNLRCPALELVRIACQQEKLAHLSELIKKVPPTSWVQQRNANALEALIALEAGSPAQDALKEIWSVVEKPYPADTSATERLAEFVVAWRAGQDPKYWIVGSDIARKLRDYERNPDSSSRSDAFKRDVNVLVGDIERFAISLSKKTQDKEASENSSQWVLVPYLKPEHRRTGYRPSTWSLGKGIAQHFPGETWGQLFFQSPLRGKFEIHANRTTHGHKEVSIAWGMHNAEPRYDQKGVRVTKVMHSSRDLDKELELPFWDQQADFRIAVDGNKVTTWTNGVLIHEETFNGPPDPWLLLQTQESINFACVSNLRILGTPEIPSEIDLLDIAGLASWRADIYNEWFRTDVDPERSDDVPWVRVGDELVGRLRKNSTSEHHESLILYQRPMLEDGVIEFETWYEPNKFEVHPALGRSALMLTPEGIRLHQLTDAQHESRGLRPDNHHPLAGGASSLQLKEKDWNQVRLTLKGDQLTIHVNGVEAVTVPVAEPANERQFGLFRYSNKTQCRVRELLYRGEWPKTLPSLEDQQLAAPHQGYDLANASVVLDVDLSQSQEQLKSQKVNLRGPKDRWESSADGLKLHLHDTKTWGDTPGLSIRQPIEGDCEITVAYKDLQLSPQKAGWGVAFSFDVVIDDPQKTRVECNLTLDRNDALQHTTQLFHARLDGTNDPIDAQYFHPAQESGRLRLVRRGGRIECYKAVEGSDQFVWLNSLTVGNARIREVNCSGKSSDAVAKMNITLTRLTIRQGS